MSVFEHVVGPRGGELFAHSEFAMADRVSGVERVNGKHVF